MWRRRKRGFLVVFVTLSLLPVWPTANAAVGAPIDNGEQRVTGHGLRGDAEQFSPDISSSFMVWIDTRGTKDSYPEGPFGVQRNIWAKSLGTRDESPVKTALATDDANPRVSGNWTVWTDHSPDPDEGGPLSSNDDIYACQLPCSPGSIQQLTDDPAHQMNPAIDGTTVVWEDYRNEGIANVGVDLFTKKIGEAGNGSPVLVGDPAVVAIGDQVHPSISGTMVAWRDDRRSTLDPNLPLIADVYVRDIKRSANEPIEIARAEGNARSLSEFAVAVAGTNPTRVLWNEKDPACDPNVSDGCQLPQEAKFCELARNATACGPAQDVDSDLAPSGIFDQVADLDLSGSQAVWSTHGHAYTRDLATMSAIVAVDDTPNGESGARVDVESRTGVQRFAWGQFNDGGDVYWREATTQPQRANSVGLGPFAGQFHPAADGDTVVYLGGYKGDVAERGIASPSGQFGGMWATDLSGARNPRHYEIATELATGLTEPRMAGDGSGRVVGGHTLGQVFEQDALNPSFETIRDLSHLGAPDADGSGTAYRCGDAAICVHDGATQHFFDVSDEFEDPLAPENSMIGEAVRMSGNLVVWHEFYCLPGEEGCNNMETRLHVLDSTPGASPVDRVIADGFDAVDEFPEFDFSGDTVIWTHSVDETTSRLMTASASCTDGGDLCPQEFENLSGHRLGSPSIDGDRVVWLDCTDCLFEFGEFATDVYTRLLSDTDSHLVTNESQAGVNSPYVDGDRIFWVDTRNGPASSDIYMENAVDPSDIIALDTTAPTLEPNALKATRFGGAVELSWTNPPDPDFLRVRLLRRSGADPGPGFSWLDDNSVSVVFEGTGTVFPEDVFPVFTDTDVVPGVTYTYALVALDYEPNYSAPQTATT